MATQGAWGAKHQGMCTDGPSEDSITGDPWHEKTFPQAHASAWETGCRRGAAGLWATCRCSLEAIVHPQAQSFS